MKQLTIPLAASIIHDLLRLLGRPREESSD